MKKATTRIRPKKQPVANVDHTKTMLKTYIPAGNATQQPPLGSQLAQRHINVQNFCSMFNEMTKNIKPGIPIPTRVQVLPDNKFQIFMNSPPSSYLLKQAAGLLKGRYPGETVAGMITVKHIYEIAKVKSQDRAMALLTLQQVCDMLVKTARTCGIKVVHTMDAKEYAEFLSIRGKRYGAYTEELQKIKEAKLLRVKGEA